MDEGVLQHALDYAELGLAVTPRLADCSGFSCPHGLHDAVSDPDAVRELFRLHPAPNVSMTTGAKSGVFVLDVDCGKDDGQATLEELERRLGALPATVEGTTPSGGRHVWFIMPKGGLRSRTGFVPGLDVCADKKSIPLPPSFRRGRPGKPDGAYTWVRSIFAHEVARAPRWLLDLIDPPEPERPPAEPLKITSTERGVRYVLRAVEGEYDAVAQAGSGGRNHRLNVAACKLGQLVGDRLLTEKQVYEQLEKAAAKCGLVKEDGYPSVRATIASGLRWGITNRRGIEF